MDGFLDYFGSLDPSLFVAALPGNIAQGILWGIMALGVYITFRILNFADLTVDGSFTCTFAFVPSSENALYPIEYTEYFTSPS